jgi:isopentenyl diphosphate isomerase/L-lactate dehydrogenase-like FMN-dependent dehydrogenase
MVDLFDPTLTWRDLEDLAGMSALPLVIKGILSREDARLAVEHGAAGISVSNHGGRQLDGVPASLDALPEIVDEVAGEIPVLVDGGIRRGTDVAKALALGARAVMVGRPVIWALAARGEAGVLHVLELLRDEVRLALALLGCSAPDEVGRGHLVRASGR